MAKWSISDMGLEYFNPEEAAQTPTEMVKEYVKTSGQKPDSALYLGLIYEEFVEWENERPKTTGELKELADLVYVIYGYANAIGYNLDEALRRVHTNNMGRMYQPDGTIKRREDGKIEKNKEYPKVNLEDLV